MIVDEHGYTEGFSVDQDQEEIGRFGADLDVGTSCTDEDGRVGTITRVSTRIHTRPVGSNYVHVEIEWEAS